VISTAGPFQRQDYAVARASIEAGAHYVDIADGRDFVCGIGALDGEARSRGVLVVSGASSVPALSSAVVDRLAPQFAAVREIDIGISASARMPGLATIESVLAYCGKPFTRWSDGRWVRIRGWRGLRRHRFRAPPMARWICDCDVPDLAIFPARYPGVRDVRFGAGVEWAPVQMGLWLLALLVSARVISDAARLAGPLRSAGRALEPLGTGRSAMSVRVSGTDASATAITRTWELAAANDEGINIPCMAAVALARKLARGEIAARGAMPCVGLVSLEDYLDALRPWTIAVREDGG
jgi:hypothetical protein